MFAQIAILIFGRLWYIIPVELLQILKIDAVKSASHNMPANFENPVVVIGLEKVSFHSNPKERQS